MISRIMNGLMDSFFKRTNASTEKYITDPIASTQVELLPKKFVLIQNETNSILKKISHFFSIIIYPTFV